jgi:hypothetical protein
MSTSEDLLNSNPTTSPTAPPVASRAAVQTQPASTVEQCQPVLRADASNVWANIESELQRIDAAMKNACAALGIEAYIARKNAFEFLNSVYFEAWIPIGNDPHLTERVWAQVTLQPKPWHTYPIEYAIKAHSRGHDKPFGLYGALPDENIHALLTYLVRDGTKPSFSPALREPHHKFPKTLSTFKNKPVGMKSDGVTNVATFFAAACVLAFFASGSLPGDEGVFVVGAAIFILVVCLIVMVARAGGPYAIRSTGRPDFQPRVMRVYDSWQVVLFGAGPSREVFYERFLDVLRNAPIPDMKAEIEPVAYRVLGELVSREQIVLSARRGIIYCQIYPFGNDLYVGWQSFLNRGCWNEFVVSQGFDKITGRRVKFQSVNVGSENLCEYDYADTNCLTEWTHAQMVALIRQLMAELKIDQEIDFKIVRGDRPSPDAPPQQQQEKKGGFFRRKH